MTTATVGSSIRSTHFTRSRPVEFLEESSQADIDNPLVPSSTVEGRSPGRATGVGPVAAVPVSIVLLGPSSASRRLDRCLQLNPQPILAASLQPGTNSASLSWQGHFTEQLREPSATPTASGATPAAWLVDVVYNLTGQLPAASAGATFDVKGTASEKLTPLDAAGNVISTAKTWVSTDKIESHFAVVGMSRFLPPPSSSSQTPASTRP